MLLVNYINLKVKKYFKRCNLMGDDKPIQIFSSPEKNVGVNVVKSPVKLIILEMLRSSEMEFDEIVSNTGKSKSTVSVHLKGLREMGIVSYKPHPDDNRKKISTSMQELMSMALSRLLIAELTSRIPRIPR